MTERIDDKPENAADPRLPLEIEEIRILDLATATILNGAIPDTIQECRPLWDGMRNGDYREEWQEIQELNRRINRRSVVQERPDRAIQPYLKGQRSARLDLDQARRDYRDAWEGLQEWRERMENAGREPG